VWQLQLTVWQLQPPFNYFESDTLVYTYILVLFFTQRNREMFKNNSKG